MSAYFPTELLAVAQENARRHPWARAARDRMVERARPWMAMGDDELWGLMFGSTITRSFMVWSNGHCPCCGVGVPMYEWLIRPLELPWKVRCPRCAALFPTNDFTAYYRSGLDERGVFDPGRADRSLLVNAAHPAPDDPLRSFGVDDGEGAVDGRKRWRFIGAYLIYGQWKGLILGGITALAEAYVVTGEREYARRAGIILHRVADLYPSHDFELQGLAYEKGHGSGYVSTWHDACAEARQLALAYDMLKSALAEDDELAAFLADKARLHHGAASCATPAEVCRHIEEGILRDTLANTKKITSNFPQTDITRLVIMTVLGQPPDAAEPRGIMEAMVEKATAVDGVTGEKGMTAYTAGAVAGMAQFLALGERARPGFLPSMLEGHARLPEMFRFHLDTWCLQRYYPNSGDSGHFAERKDTYAGVSLSREIDLRPSMFAFLLRLAEHTGEDAYVQAAYGANGNRTEGLPYDLFARDPAAIEGSVRTIVDREGALIRRPSLRKDAWRIAILRSGAGEHARAVWVTSRVGGGHHHGDGMNLGLFARGLDLLPDFGYPPVNYGGWGSPQARWYRMAAAHNTVIVDGEEQREASATTAGWGTGRTVQLMRFSAPTMTAASRYERTVLLVDVSEEGFYLVDLFRVAGGREHCWMMHSCFGTLELDGPSPLPASESSTPAWLRALPLRDLRVDPRPPTSWSAEWRVEDRFGYLSAGSQVHLRATCLTPGAQAWLASAWLSVGGYRNEEAWIPELMVRREAASAAPLESCFVSVLEPYGEAPFLRSVRRIAIEAAGGPALGELSVALEVTLADGRIDLLMLPELGGETVAPSVGLRTDAELCFLRRRAGELEEYALAGGSRLELANAAVRLPGHPSFAEGRMSGASPSCSG